MNVANCDTVSLEAFATWLAHHVYFAPRSAEALARIGIDLSEFDRARSHWQCAIQDDVASERDERVILFGETFAAVRKRLRTQNPPIESLGPLPRVVEAVAPEPAAPPLAAAPSAPVAPPAVPARATYQLEQPRVAPSAPEPSVASSFEPDETLPIPAPFAAKPAIPFAGGAPPEKVAQMFDPVEPRARNAEPAPDETALTPIGAFVMPRTGTFRDQLTPLVVPILSLDEYAELRARLTVYGEDHAPTLTRFGVAAPEVHEAQRARFSDYFQRDPSAQAVFLKTMQTAIGTVRAERDAEARPARAPEPDRAPLSPGRSAASVQVDATGEIEVRDVADVLRERNILPFDKSAPAKPPPPSAPQEQSGQTELIKAFDLDELLGTRKTELAPVPSLPLPIERFAQIQAALTKSRDRDEALRHFGIQPAGWHAVAATMNAALSASESLRSRYQDLYRRAMQG